MSLNNILLIKDVSNYDFNFKSLFNKEDSIIWKNCEDLTINIDNKINKLIFNNCKRIKINCNNLISGIEYFKCKEITQTLDKDHNISCLDIYATNITIVLDKHTVLPKIINEKSNISLEYIN